MLVMRETDICVVRLMGSRAVLRLRASVTRVVCRLDFAIVGNRVIIPSACDGQASNRKTTDSLFLCVDIIGEMTSLTAGKAMRSFRGIIAPISCACPSCVILHSCNLKGVA